MPTDDASLDPEFAPICDTGNALIQAFVQGRTPRVFIISGPSGVGKDSVIEDLRTVYPDARYVVTATSRPMRPTEIDGVHYLFLERGDFERRIAAGEFIEHALVYENLYGVPKWPIVEGLDNNQHVIIKVDVQGAATLREIIPQAVSIFLLPESMEALWGRLSGRDRLTVDPEVLITRFRTACAELKRIGEFDYAVFNEADKLDAALNEIVGIIDAEQRRVTQPDIRLG
jgi:guanylate kinase